MSNLLFKLDINEDYNDYPLLRKKYKYLMKAFVDWDFRNAELKAFNFVRKFLQSFTLADISTADGKRISFQTYTGVESIGLCKDLS